ncbi:ATP-binding protein [Streptomyces sp. NPDC029216]|uniref:sensor histidine kinase n=1 Tax=Streptomyces sp. NPDC029216 TaxID=3154701 RepID=UPI003406180F
MRAVLRSERARLTALYGSLLVLAGGGLIALVNLLLRGGLYARISGVVTTAVPRGDFEKALTEGGRTPVPAQTLPAGRVPRPDQFNGYAVTRNLSSAVEQATLHELLLVSLVALAFFAVLSIWLAWWMAGRVLRPVGVITETARRLSGANLHERIGLQAPPGELKRLADTFDGMLDRMEGLVGAQRRFAANAAHELRTPLAVQRAAAEIGLAGDPAPEKVARIRERLIGVADSSEHLIESLLLLAVSEEGLEATEPVDLAALAGAALEATAHEGLEVVTDLAPLTVRGDHALLDHLIRNLLTNAVRHNRPGGRIEVTTAAAAPPAAGQGAPDGPPEPEGGVLTVSNTGPVIDPEDVPRLLEPFRRRVERRHTAGEGAGLGLSLVASIARAHGAGLRAEANPAPDGGMTIRVRFEADPGPGPGDGRTGRAIRPIRPV